MDDATKAKIRLGRLRFLGGEAERIREELAKLFDRINEEGYDVPTPTYGAAITIYAYLEDFAREALF